MSVASLDKIGEVQTELYGGKAASLAKMIGEGFEVPPGFVIDADSYDDMTAELENQIYEAFDQLGAEYVAVRSSATAEDGETAAWAGQLDTFLNTVRDDLIENVKACWSSLNSDRAKAYAEQNRVDLGTQKVAVVVQAMVQSEVAGVAFSAHPVTQSLDQIVVEAAYGLGEAVVAGQVTPDTYIVTKLPFRIVEKHLSKQTRKLVKIDGLTDWRKVEMGEEQKLSDQHIEELAGMVMELENYYGFAVDVEWLLFEGELCILQSRPITTLDNKSYTDVKEKE